MTNPEAGLLARGAALAGRNKRYVVWFFVLNFVLATLGAAAFRAQVSNLLDRSLYANGLLHGFDVGVYVDMVSNPGFGPISTSTTPGVILAVLFFALTLLCLPGVFLGYATEHRISREDFFRACGKALWRFVRLAIVFAILAGIVGGVLGGIEGALSKAAGNSSNERLPFYVTVAGTLLILLALTALRMWFDLAEADVVVADQRAVRRSLGKAWRQMRGQRLRLLGAYVGISAVALVTLAVGVWVWAVFVPPSSAVTALVIGQVILFLLLCARFWQRGTAVAFYLAAEAAEAPVLVIVPTGVPTGVPALVASEAPAEDGAEPGAGFDVDEVPPEADAV